MSATGASYGFWSRYNDRPGRMAEHHAHADLEWGYLLRGSLHYRMAGRDQTVPLRRLFVFWAGMPHRSMRPSADARAVVGVIPWPRFLAWALPGGDRLLSGSILAGGADTHGDDERLLGRWIADLGHGGAAHTRQVESEICARVGRLLLHEAQAVPASVPSEAVRCMIESLTADPTRTIADAARLADLNLKYAFGVFRRHTGFTPRRWLECYRIALSQSHLAAGETLERTWRRAGFRSRRTWHAAFIASLGATPASWQRRWRNLALPPATGEGKAGDTDAGAK